MDMHEQLGRNLLALADIICAEKGWKYTTLSIRAYGKAGFLDSVKESLQPEYKGSFAFSARKYDEFVLWASLNWPRGQRWPAGIKRPSHD